MTELQKNPFFELFVLGIIAAFIEAVCFVVILSYSLPPTDMAYGSAPFDNEVVVLVMSAGAVATGLLVFPFSAWLLRRVNLSRSFGPLLIPGLVAFLMTPFIQIASVPLALIATVGGMFYCRRKYPIAPATDDVFESV